MRPPLKRTVLESSTQFNYQSVVKSLESKSSRHFRGNQLKDVQAVMFFWAGR